MTQSQIQCREVIMQRTLAAAVIGGLGGVAIVALAIAVFVLSDTIAASVNVQTLWLIDALFGK